MQDLRKLDVRARSHALALHIYDVTQQFPPEERFGQMNQLRRCCASIPTNIAEGCGCETAADMARFLQIAMGSASELHYHLILSKDLRLLETECARELLHEVIGVKRMLAVLLQRVRSPRSEPVNRQP